MRALKSDFSFMPPLPTPGRKTILPHPLEVLCNLQVTSDFEMLLYKNCLNRYNTYRITETYCFLSLDQQLFFPVYLFSDQKYLMLFCLCALFSVRWQEESLVLLTFTSGSFQSDMQSSVLTCFRGDLSSMMKSP